jgi:hypothetical protein
MANQDQHDRDVRTPSRDAAERDARNAVITEPEHEDSESNRQAAARNRATTPNEVSEETVAEIAADAEARARR